MKPVEIDFICGDRDSPETYRLAPYLGLRHLERNILHGVVLGRLARLEQVQLQPAAYTAALLNDACLWLRSGYPRDLVAKFWGQRARRTLPGARAWATAWAHLERQAFQLSAMRAYLVPWHEELLDVP